MARTRPEAAHAPGVCRLAGCPLAGPLPPHAHACEVDARAAQITTVEGRTVRKTTVVPAPVSSAHCLTAAGRRWGNRWVASEGRPAGPPKIRPSTDHRGSHRRTATDSQGAAVAAGPAGAVGRADEAVRNTDPRTGRTAAAARSGAAAPAG